MAFSEILLQHINPRKRLHELRNVIEKSKSSMGSAADQYVSGACFS